MLLRLTNAKRLTPILVNTLHIVHAEAYTSNDLELTGCTILRLTNDRDLYVREDLETIRLSANHD